MELHQLPQLLLFGASRAADVMLSPT